MTQMRYDFLVEGLGRVISHTSLRSAREPRYRTIAGGERVENDRRGHIVVVMPWL